MANYTPQNYELLYLKIKNKNMFKKKKKGWNSPFEYECTSLGGKATKTQSDCV